MTVILHDSYVGMLDAGDRSFGCPLRQRDASQRRMEFPAKYTNSGREPGVRHPVRGPLHLLNKCSEA